MGNIADAVVKDTGLSLVKETPKGILFRTASGVHMQVNHAGAPVEIRIAIPYRDDTAHLLPMVLSSSTPVPAATFTDGHLLLIYKAKDTTELIMYAQKAENLGALLKSGVFAPDADDDLKQLVSPLNMLNKGDLEPSLLKSLARLLSLSPVVQTDGHPQAAASYAVQLPGYITKLAVKPHSLFFNTAGVVSLIEKTAATPACLILFDLRGMQDKKEHYLSIIHSLEMASARIPGTGASYLICQDANSSITTETRLPMVHLASKEELNDRNRLRAYGIAQSQAELATFQSLQSGTDSETALFLMREDHKYRNRGEASSFSSLNALPEEAVSQLLPVSNDEVELQKIVKDALEPLVGHEEIKEELIRLLPRWALQKNRKPLVIIFTGPSGCGKTFLATLLGIVNARLFGMPNPAYIPIDLPGHLDCLFGLTGSTVGLIGSNNQGILERAAAQSAPVLAFNEFEKVLGRPSELIPLIETLLDQYEFTNGRGRRVTFPPTSLFVFTSNMGGSAAQERKRSIGFSSNANTPAGADRTAFEEWFYKKVPAPMIRRLKHRFFFSSLSVPQMTELAMRLLEQAFQEAGGSPTRRTLQTAARRLAEQSDPLRGIDDLSEKVDRYVHQKIKRSKK